MIRNVAKKDWIKTSFWAPENTPDNQDASAKPAVGEAAAAPTKKLYCPIFEKTENGVKKQHQLKLKELIPLKFDSEETTGENGKIHESYICWVCQKKLQHQKISVFTECSHVMCKSCIKAYCKGNKCS